LCHVQSSCIIQDADEEGVDGPRAFRKPWRKLARMENFSSHLAALDLIRPQHRERQPHALPHDAGRIRSIPPGSTDQGDCLHPATSDRFSFSCMLEAIGKLAGVDALFRPPRCSGSSPGLALCERVALAPPRCFVHLQHPSRSGSPEGKSSACRYLCMLKWPFSWRGTFRSRNLTGAHVLTRWVPLQHASRLNAA